MTQGFRILVVDDEPQIQRFLRHALEAAGYQVSLAEKGSAALKGMASESPDLVILDLGLPDFDGKTLVGQIRQTMDTPILILSARDDEDEKIAALDLGANDYVEKPFSIGELLARIRALLRPRKASATDDRSLRLGPLVIDPDAHRITRGEEVIKLTPTEFKLLEMLARHPGRVLTHRQILAKVWGAAHTEDVAYLRVFIGQLRQKIEDNPAEPVLIVTEPGVGYRAG